ncbi:MAG: SDR family NAD(P)-dependent oxidoreductase [Pseudomonadales bacterium]
MAAKSAHRVTVVVGAGSAIGAAIAACALAEGPVFALSRAAASLPGAAASIAWDPGCPSQMIDAVQTVANATSRVDRLVICNGLLTDAAHEPPLRAEKALRQLERDAFLHGMAVNAWAPLAALKAFEQLLRAAPDPRAAVLSAMVGSIGDNRAGGWFTYRMSKAALNMGVRNVAIEWSRLRAGPLVASIHPGTTLSALSAPFVGPERARCPEESAAAVLRVLDALTPANSGGFFNWDGRELPW